MDIFKKSSAIRKFYLKRISTPLRITKRILDMKYKFNKIYKNFYYSSTDLKKQKEIEEYLKFQSKLKYRLQNFIKMAKLYFNEKIKVKDLYLNKSSRINERNNIYFNIIINYDKKFIHQPYLLPIRKRDILLNTSCITDANMANAIKKYKSINKKNSINLLGNKKMMRSSNSIKGKLNLRSSFITKKNEKEKKNIKISIHKNINSLIFDDKNKNRIIKIKKSLYNKNKDENNIFHSPNNLLRKKLILVDNNIHPLQLWDNRISAIKNIKAENNANKSNINLNIIEGKIEQKAINLNNNMLNNNFKRDNLNNIKRQNFEVKNNSLKLFSSYSDSKKNNDLKYSHSISIKYSMDSLNKEYYNYNNKKESLIEYNDMNINSISKKNTTIYEQNKNAFKLLPILNQNFNSTMDKSNKLHKKIKIFKKEAKIRTKHSKRKTNKITKKYFDKIEEPTIKSTLRIAKKRPWSREVNKYIYEDKKGHINFKFSYEKKEKSPLTFVEEYNRMRNRRRRINKKITSNIGFGVFSKQGIKENKLKSYFGLSFNTNKYY